MTDFKSPAGSFDNSHGKDRDPKSSGKPSVGITNDSRGNLGDKGPGPGTGANASRIR